MYKKTLHENAHRHRATAAWLRLNAELIISIRNYFFRVCFFSSSLRSECVWAKHTFCFLHVFCFVALTSSSTTTTTPLMTMTTVWLVSHSLSGRVKLFGWLIFFFSPFVSCCCCSLCTCSLRCCLSKIEYYSAKKKMKEKKTAETRRKKKLWNWHRTSLNIVNYVRTHYNWMAAYNINGTEHSAHKRNVVTAERLKDPFVSSNKI